MWYVRFLRKQENRQYCRKEVLTIAIYHCSIKIISRGKGKSAVVIGRSLVVGKPAAMMLIGKNATVTVCHTKTVDTAAVCREADIIISAAGVLNSLTKDYVRPGQIVIDVSMNWNPEKITSRGKGGMSGDAVFEEVEPIVEAITPVPGGVGAVTTTVLMKHVVEAAEKA